MLNWTCFMFIFRRGSLLSTAMFVYAAVSPVNGYFGGSLYSRMGGRDWIKQMLLSAFLLPALVCGTAFFINFIAIYYHASRAIPFGTMIAIMCICLFVILPLTLVGTVLGRNLAGQPNYPCRINAVPRPIPEKKWYVKMQNLTVMSCLIGFVMIKLFFNSIFWRNYKRNVLSISNWSVRDRYIYFLLLGL